MHASSSATEELRSSRCIVLKFIYLVHFIDFRFRRCPEEGEGGRGAGGGPPARGGGGARGAMDVPCSCFGLAASSRVPPRRYAEYADAVFAAGGGAAGARRAAARLAEYAALNEGRLPEVSGRLRRGAERGAGGADAPVRAATALAEVVRAVGPAARGATLSDTEALVVLLLGANAGGPASGATQQEEAALELLEAILEGPGGCEAERAALGARFLPDLCRAAGTVGGGAAPAPRALRCLALLSGARAAAAAPLAPSALAALGAPLNANLPGVRADGARALLRGLGRDQIASPAGARATLGALLPSLGTGGSDWEAEAQGLLLEAAGARGQRLAAFLALAAGLPEPSAPGADGAAPCGFRRLQSVDPPTSGPEAVAALGFVLGWACCSPGASSARDTDAAVEVAARLGAVVFAEEGPDDVARAVAAALRCAGAAPPGASSGGTVGGGSSAKGVQRACRVLGRVLDGLPPEATRGGGSERGAGAAWRAISAVTEGTDPATAAAGSDLLNRMGAALGSPRKGGALGGRMPRDPRGGGVGAGAGLGGGAAGLCVPFGNGSEQLVAAAGAEVFAPESAFASAKEGAEAVGALERALEEVAGGGGALGAGRAWDELEEVVRRCRVANPVEEDPPAGASLMAAAEG